MTKYEIIKVVHATNVQYEIPRVKGDYVTIVKDIIFRTEEGEYTLTVFNEDGPWIPSVLYHREGDGEKDCPFCDIYNEGDMEMCTITEHVLDATFEELKAIPTIAAEFS